MICPGVKRPPPMGSELVSGLLLIGVRGVRGEEGEAGVFREAGVDGASVAPPKLASSPSTVSPVSGSTAAPHEVQNLPFGDTCAPHFAQNMVGGDSTICAWPAAIHAATAKKCAQPGQRCHKPA